MASLPPAPPGSNPLDHVDQQGDQDPELDAIPKPGQLGLIGRRAWKTWQVVIVIAVALGLGLWWNYKPVGSSASPNQRSYVPPPPSGATTTTTTAASSASTTTTSAGGALPNSTTGTTQPAKLLLAGHQQTGNWTSTPFTTTAAGWIIGWAYACNPAPASGPSLQIFVTPVGATASGTPAITETGASGQEGPQNVTTQSGVGAQQLIVEAPPQCEWAVKVTGN